MPLLNLLFSSRIGGSSAVTIAATSRLNVPFREECTVFETCISRSIWFKKKHKLWCNV